MSSATPTFTLGKSIILFVNLITTIAPYVADWKYVLTPLKPITHILLETHIHNPTWPPHAKYHNGQTMSMGLFTGLITFYILLVHLPSSPSSGTSSSISPQTQITHLTWVAVLQSMIYLSSLSGILYPGALWMDPQFGDGKPQLYGFPGIVGMVWVGWGIERARLLGGDGKGKRV